METVNSIREKYQSEVTNPEEEAFNEAVDDYYESLARENRNYGKFINRRR